ncbi:MAG TPA: hypothetical protein DEF51_51005, partial [Myxococcales bacterium]|nr:hypothetical protein [Myxococcales bacterium]
MTPDTSNTHTRGPEALTHASSDPGPDDASVVTRWMVVRGGLALRPLPAGVSMPKPAPQGMTGSGPAPVTQGGGGPPGPASGGVLPPSTSTGGVEPASRGPSAPASAGFDGRPASSS